MIEKSMVLLKLAENKLYFEKMRTWNSKNEEKTKVLSEISGICSRYSEDVSNTVEILRRTESQCHTIIDQAMDDCVRMCDEAIKKIEEGRRDEEVV